MTEKFQPPDALMIAAGIAGWQLVGALMTVLEMRGLLTREDGRTIIDHALTGVEGLTAAGDHPALHQARVLLEKEMRSWLDATSRQTP